MLKTRTLLKNSEMFSTFSVPDIDKAKRFYGETLGLDVRDSSEPGIIEIHGKGGPPVTVYPKPDHKPAVFTVLNFPVDDIDQAVDELTAVGVKFERYDSDFDQDRRQGHRPRQRPVDRVVPRPGRQHPVGDESLLAVHGASSPR